MAKKQRKMKTVIEKKGVYAIGELPIIAVKVEAYFGFESMREAGEFCADWQKRKPISQENRLEGSELRVMKRKGRK
jgi:hypothetical protein